MPYQVAICLPTLRLKTSNNLMENILEKNLKDVFGDAVNIRILYVDHLDYKGPVDADLFINPGTFLFRQILESGVVPHIQDLITISRAIPKAAASRLSELKAGDRVLVVNDTEDLVNELTDCLRNLNLDGVTFIPYKEADAAAGKYRGIPIAIHPNELPFVPDYIPRVIDIGDRWIDTNTMIRIATKLNLQTEEITARLFRYSELLLEGDSSFSSAYLENYLKGAMLQQYTRYFEEGMIFCTRTLECIYANELSRHVFSRLNLENRPHLEEILPEACADDYTGGIIEIENEHYLVGRRPVWLDDLLAGFCITIRNISSIGSLNAEIREKMANGGMAADYTFDHIIHRSEAMYRVIERARLSAATDYSVLIQGESGTGKELIAQSIHNASPRKKGPFVAINCAAMSATLLESELFGYVGGAFTGANKQGKTGLFERANGGTLFLDEIGEMQPGLQAALLRALQEKTIRRVGGDRMISVDVRLIAATNRDLLTEVEAGNFRADLYYRVNSLPLVVPPLRERKTDIPLLLSHYMGQEWHFLRDEEKEQLINERWPGNVRQLENFAHYYKTTHSMEGFFPTRTRMPKENTAEEKDYGMAGEAASGEKEQVKKTAPKNFDWLPAVPERRRESVSEAVYICIQKNTTPSHGIGRTSLLSELKNQGYKVSDAWLRKCLAELEAEGRITIGKGRTGCRVPD